MKRLLPPILLEFYSRIQNRKYGWKGDYKTWKEAKDVSTGYETNEIILKVKQSLLKVKNGEAVYERDSLIFDEIHYSWPLLAGLMFACTAFALSAIGLVRNIVLTRTALIVIATLCIIRSLIIIPALIRADTWNIIASSVWLYLGVCFLMGAVTFHNLKPNTNS